jgi:Sulfotransferase family
VAEPSGTASLLRLYGGAAARVARRGRKKGAGGASEATESPVFVVGAPRSGPTFMAGSLGKLPGFVDLGEVEPLKVSIHELAALPQAEAAIRLRRTLERVRSLGLARRLRAIEQTPETSFLVPAALLAYPEARVVHMVRDGRDVVCSLLAKGWLSDDRPGEDDVGVAYGGYARFWVEPERVQEFAATSDARRAAWAWRRYVTAVRAAPTESTLEVRYEELAADSRAVAGALAEHLGTDRELLAQALEDVHAGSVGRWRRDLSAEQVAEAEAEAGGLLRELGYL